MAERIEVTRVLRDRFIINYGGRVIPVFVPVGFDTLPLNQNNDLNRLRVAISRNNTENDIYAEWLNDWIFYFDEEDVQAEDVFRTWLAEWSNYFEEDTIKMSTNEIKPIIDTLVKTEIKIEYSDETKKENSSENIDMPINEIKVENDTVLNIADGMVKAEVKIEFPEEIKKEFSSENIDMPINEIKVENDTVLNIADEMVKAEVKIEFPEEIKKEFSSENIDMPINEIKDENDTVLNIADGMVKAEVRIEFPDEIKKEFSSDAINEVKRENDVIAQTVMTTLVGTDITTERVVETNKNHSSNFMDMSIVEQKIETDGIASIEAQSHQEPIDDDEQWIQELLGFYLN